MKPENRQYEKLVEAGAEALAEALLQLARKSEEAEDMIERLTATPEENIKRYKKKLAALKRSRRFVRWGASSELAGELQSLLQDLKASSVEPLAGCELAAQFYKLDSSIFGRCDDSSGRVGSVFYFDARVLFVEYASACDEKDKVADIVFKLNQKDAYGARDVLVNHADFYLPEPVIRSMIAKFQKLAEKAQDDHQKQHCLRLVQSLARQIGDAGLFEKTCLSSDAGKLYPATIIDIAEVYLECGDAEKAYDWLCKFPENQTYNADERDKLLLEVYQRQGNQDKAAELLYQFFKEHPTPEKLEALLDVVGHKEKETIISEEVNRIMSASKLNDMHARFLIEIGKNEEAERYLVQRSDQVQGEFYRSWVSLVKIYESEGLALGASLIYRGLLMSILQRAYTPAYTHGARYLKKLDKLADLIADWKECDNHQQFKEKICETHSRKKSFWSRYEGS